LIKATQGPATAFSHEARVPLYRPHLFAGAIAETFGVNLCSFYWPLYEGIIDCLNLRDHAMNREVIADVFSSCSAHRPSAFRIKDEEPQASNERRNV
jgi:hypothetical protein